MLGIVLILLAGAAMLYVTLPPAGPYRLLRQCRNLGIMWFGGLIPLTVFLFSVVLAPESRGQSDNEWLRCFHGGKLALLPVVLFAAVALYRFETTAKDGAPARWIACAIFIGAFTALACLVLGLPGALGQGFDMVLVVPIYVVLWYGWRCAEVCLYTRLDKAFWLSVALSALPFWILSIYWTNKIREELPTDPPKCFVVTAASQGHVAVVGPWVNVDGLAGRRVNMQLLTLWRFETLWMSRSPGSHAAFRVIYNRCGPIIAARVRGPYLADLIFIALKPVEWVARLCLRFRCIGAAPP